MGVATWVTMRVVVTTTLTITLSLASELEPSPLLATLIGTLLWSGTSVMGLTKLSTWWKGSEDSSDGWMTSSVTSGLTLMLKSCKDLSFGEVPGARYESLLVLFRSQFFQLSCHLSREVYRCCHHEY
jgi:hypothetical protein